MSDTRRLALELHEIRQLALSHATNPQFGNSSVDGEGLSFRDGDGHEVGRIGGDGGNGLEIRYVDAPKPLPPTAPVATGDANLIRVEWDGGWVRIEGGTPVRDLDAIDAPAVDRVEVHVSMDENFVPDPVLSFAGVLPVTPEGGAHTVGPLVEAGDYYVVLMARGKDGQYSAPSQRVHVVTTVGLMENELFDLALRADEARESADGKNTVHYGEEPVAPDGGFAEGDLWFDTTEDPETGFRKNMPHLWDPSANGGEGGWVSVRDGRFETVQDAIDDLDEAVEQIIETPGGMTLYYQPSAPGASTTPPPKDGDTWFRTASDGITGHFERVGGAWVEHKMTDEVIANLHAGKITSGYLDAARIAAGTITADKLLIGSGANIIPWNLTAGTAPHLAQSGVELSVGSDPDLGQVMVISPGSRADGTYAAFLIVASGTPIQGQAQGHLNLPLDTGRSYLLSAKFALTTPAPAGVSPRLQWEVQYLDGLGVYLGRAYGALWEPTAEMLPYELSIDPPPNTKFMRVQIRKNWWSTGTLAMAETSLRIKSGATLIENGAITTEKIAVGAITAESGIIGSLDAGVITTGELRGELIRAQSIAGESLAVDAIDGKTITGATIRTSAAGARVELDASGLRQYNLAGQPIVDMTGGNVTVMGALYSGQAGFSRVQIDNQLWPGGQYVPREDGSMAQAIGAGVRVGRDAYHSVDVFHGEYDELNGTVGEASVIRGPGTTAANALYQTNSGKAWWRSTLNDERRVDMSILPERSVFQYTSHRGGTTYAATAQRAWVNGSFTAGHHQTWATASGHSDSVQMDVGQPNGLTPQGMLFQVKRTGVDGNGLISLSNTATRLEYGAAAVSLSRTTLGNNRVVLTGDSFRFSGISTGTGATNASITSTGYITRTSSTRRLKLAGEPVERRYGDAGFDDALLSVPAVTWFDKGDAERLSDYKTAVENDEWPDVDPDMINPLRRIPGVFAEDVDDAGLSDFVEYDEGGRPSGVFYDRMGVALIPVVRRLRDRVDELEKKMGEMADA